MDEDIQSYIAYLDDFHACEPSSTTAPTREDMMTLMRALIDWEVERHGYQRNTEELSQRLGLLESRMEFMVRMVAKQRHLPPIQYVAHKPRNEPTTTIAAPKVPKLMVAYYVLGLVCSIVFAALLALSGTGRNLIHPFLSLLGLVGGLGWLTTALTDLLSWKRENPVGNRTPKAEKATANAA